MVTIVELTCLIKKVSYPMPKLPQGIIWKFTVMKGGWNAQINLSNELKLNTAQHFNGLKLFIWVEFDNCYSKWWNGHEERFNFYPAIISWDELIFWDLWKYFTISATTDLRETGIVNRIDNFSRVTDAGMSWL